MKSLSPGASPLPMNCRVTRPRFLPSSGSPRTAGAWTGGDDGGGLAMGPLPTRAALPRRVAWAELEDRSQRGSSPTTADPLYQKSCGQAQTRCKKWRGPFSEVFAGSPDSNPARVRKTKDGRDETLSGAERGHFAPFFLHAELHEHAVTRHRVS